MKKLLTCLAATALLAPVTPAARAASITLTGTVRDFKDGTQAGGHPDFETYLGTDYGIVQPTLGADGKPVHETAESDPTITSTSSFNQWFRDVPGVNLSASVPITLTEVVAGSGIYEYSSSSFFPIDGALFGNQGHGHNYHFTYELHTTFTYAPGQLFSFSGDDDVWVFINDSLVIDLGGVHGELSDFVDLDTLGLTAGSTYDLDFFFAERHTVGSNLKITTSIPLVTAPVPDAAGSLGLLVSGMGSLMLYSARLRKCSRR